MNYFVTAIHTDSGKTFLSSVLSLALRADYWKPVQAGCPRDAETVEKLTAGKVKIHKERYVLNTPASPHAAAKIDGVEIRLTDFELPGTDRNLIIEGAGGCLVPINDENFIVDIAAKFNTEIILISNLYLGSINHTLLTFEALQSRKLAIKGIIFNGPPNAESQRIILRHTGLPCLLEVPQEDKIDYSIVEKYASKIKF
jgi:dethiobiotin synthetase